VTDDLERDIDDGGLIHRNHTPLLLRSFEAVLFNHSVYAGETRAN
jgi:hypothetical protein